MPTIKPLAPEVASKIAAGEVVERPASVVKELVENAIDAEARSIVVEVEEGGCARIAVIDDGIGMSGEDAALSIQRYATSKISDEADLFRLTTMGFRGEALHAISTVSKFSVETRTEDALEGTRVETDGGESVTVRAHGCPRGTCVEVRDLFYNTPARRKFLKSSAVEFGHISAEVTRTALAHPPISFELRHNGRRVWSHHAVHDPGERMKLIASTEEWENLINISDEGYGLSVSGWIGDEMTTRATPKDFHVFVNRRPVRDRLLMHGVTAGYGESLTRGRYPVAAIFLEIDPKAVDVNVHPTKREVRFENGPAVHDFLQASVRKALGEARTKRAFGTCSYERRGASDAFSAAIKAAEKVAGVREPPLTVDEGFTSRFRILGQLDRAFILCEDPEGALMVIDQHAAHERLGFEELKRQYGNGRVEQQGLLLPLTIPLGAQEHAVFERSQEALERAGFAIEPFGGSEIVVKAIPALLADADIGSLLEKMFYELDQRGSSGAIDEQVERIFALLACHAQVRAGDRLEHAEMQRLADNVVDAKLDSCPHGRPAVIRFEREDIDKWFKR